MNLLVLNVFIEVVCVGEYGRGFVVVVEEVCKFVDESDYFVRNIL